MKLYPHQEEALDLVKDYNRCAFYYDMGLGKTYIGSEKMHQLDNMTNLVICQKSKVQDWVDHFNNNYKWKVFDLTKPKQLSTFTGVILQNKYHAVGIINYDLIWRREELWHLNDFTLMLDESSLITNPTTKRARYILKLNAKNVILLSGTPTAGKYEKLWSQLKLLGWDISQNAFWNSYVKYEWVDYGGFWDKKVYGYKNVDHLKKRLSEYGAIFKKTSEVIDLPEQIDQVIYVDKSKEYKFFDKNHYLEIDGKELMGDTALTRLLYERQLCGQYSKEKLKAFKDLVESTEDRLIVFYSFTEEWHKLGKITDELGRPSSVVNGQLKHPEVLDNYDNGVLFVQYQAGAYGLNLQKANKVIYFSLPLGIGSCDLWEQSKKRIHRIGQDKTCFYYYLLVKNSVEAWNLELLKKGKDLTNRLFEEGEYAKSNN